MDLRLRIKAWRSTARSHRRHTDDKSTCEKGTSAQEGCKTRRAQIRPLPLRSREYAEVVYRASEPETYLHRTPRRRVQDQGHRSSQESRARTRRSDSRDPDTRAPPAFADPQDHR